jgi:hypothetical protein
MTKTLIAKPVVKNQFWIVTDGNEKVGNVIADGTGFEVKLNGGVAHFKNTKAIEKMANIQFQTNKKIHHTKELPFNEYPTTLNVYNSMLEVKRKLHLYTKTAKSKCYYAAGWFNLEQNGVMTPVFCPKYIFIQRYKYDGPYKSEAEAHSMINKQ